MDSFFLDLFSRAGSSIYLYSFLIQILEAIIIFVIGVFLGNLIKKIVVKILNTLNLSAISKKTAFEDFLQKAEVKNRLEDIIGSIFKWLIVLIFTVASINVLGIPTISEILNSVVLYIPKIISAIFIAGIGVLLAGIIESLVKGSVGQIDIKLGRLLGKIASYVMMIFAVMAAINELGIAKEFISILFIGFVSMTAIGFGLAIGLGAKDLVSEILTSWYQQLKKEINQKDKEK